MTIALNMLIREMFSGSHGFKMFAKGFRHVTSSRSPEYLQFNGAAERTVQTAKRLFRKSNMDNKEPFEGLLKYRNTSLEDIGASPTQLLMGRRTWTTMPIHRRLLAHRTSESAGVVEKLQHRQLVSKKFYDRNSRNLLPLELETKLESVLMGIVRAVQLRFFRGLIKFRTKMVKFTGGIKKSYVVAK